MADFTNLSGKLAFRMDTGEVKNGRAIYANAYIGGIAATAGAADTAAICGGISGLLRYPVERITLTRVDVLDI